MRNISNVWAKPAALFVAAATLAAFGIASVNVQDAHADPTTQGTYSYTLVGSDTLQAAGNALANGEDDVQAKTSDGATLASFDAFGDSPITIDKLNGPDGSIARPAGSGAGLTALVNNINSSDPKNTLVDIARSSRDPKAGTTGSNDSAHPLRWIPFGRDGVSVAVKGLGNVTLTPAQLQTLYGTNTAVYVGTQKLRPILPQSNSGTRAFFLSAIGVSAPSEQVVKSETTQENNGAELTQTGDVIPFSAAQWISQKNGLDNAPNTITAGETLASIDFGDGGVLPYETNVQTGKISPNSDFYDTTFGRTTYLVVSQAEYAADPAFQTLFNGGVSSLNANADADATGTTAYLKALYGFGPLTAAQNVVKYSTTQG